MARGVVPFWGGEQRETHRVISPDPHPSRSHPEQDPAQVCAQMGVVSGAQRDGLPWYVNCQCWCSEEILPPKSRAAKREPVGRSGSGRHPVGLQEEGGPRRYCP